MSSPANPKAEAVGSPTGPVAERLHGRLGVMSIVFMVVAAAAPLTIFVSTPLNMLASNGPGIAISYFVSPMLLLIFAVGFAAMTKYVPKAGAFYSYVTAGMGRPLGVGAGFVAVGGYLIFQHFVFSLMGQSIEMGLTSLTGEGGFNLPWWAWALIMWAITAVLGYVNIDFSAKVLSVILILEVLAVLVIDIAILAQGGGPEGVSVTSIFSADVVFSGPVGMSLLLGLSVGFGFEATAIFRDEARDPERTIPRAIFVSIISAAVFYSFATWAFVQAYGVDGVMPAIEEDPFGIVYATAAQWVGPIFMDIVTVLAITSMFACVLSYHNIAARYFHSLGHSVLPERLSAVHPRHRSPYVASMVTSAIGLVLILAWLLSGISPDVYVPWEIAVGTLSIIVVLVITSLAIFIFFRKNATLDRNVWKTAIAPILAFLILGSIMVFAMANFSQLTASEAPGLNVVLMLVPFLLLVVGVGVAFLAKARDPERYEGHHTELMSTVDAHNAERTEAARTDVAESTAVPSERETESHT